MLVVDVLNDGKAGAYCKAEYRRVHQETDAMSAYQGDDDQCLAELFHDWTDIAAIERDIDARDADQIGVHEVANTRHDQATRDDRNDRTDRYKLVAVQVQQYGKETKHRSQTNDRVGDDFSRHDVPWARLHDL